MGEVRGPEPADGRQALDAPTWMLLHHPAIQLVRQDFTTGAAARKALGRRLLEGGAFGLHQGGPCCGVVFVHVAPSRTASRWAELSISPSGNQRVHLAVRCAGLADTLGVDVWASFDGHHQIDAQPGHRSVRRPLCTARRSLCLYDHITTWHHAAIALRPRVGRAAHYFYRNDICHGHCRRAFLFLS